MRSKILAAAAAITCLGSAAHAQTAQTMQHFTRADLESALREAGATITATDTVSQRIDFTFNGGVNADALLLACEDDKLKTKCIGSSLLATFTPDDLQTPEQIGDAINTYNYKENFGRAYIDPDGTISVRTFIISDGGITRANYSRQIGLWFASVTEFFSYLYGE